MSTVEAPSRILLAVTDRETLDIDTRLTYFEFRQDEVAPIGNEGQRADWCTLAVDRSALYFGANLFEGSQFVGSSGWVVKKSSVLGSGPIEITAFRGLAPSAGAVGLFAPRGLDNLDPNFALGIFYGIGNSDRGTLCYRIVTDPGGTPSISINRSLNLYPSAMPKPVPARGSIQPLDSFDERLTRATAFHSYELTATVAHPFQKGVSGPDPEGPLTCVVWPEISFNPQGIAWLNARYIPISTAQLWAPSWATNGLNNPLFSVNFSSPVYGVNWAIRLNPFYSDPRNDYSDTPYNYNASSTSPQPWGRQSVTLIDPSDELTLWSFQMYCDAPDSWAIRVIPVCEWPPVPFLGNMVAQQGMQSQFLVDADTRTNSDAMRSWYRPVSPWANPFGLSVPVEGVVLSYLGVGQWNFRISVFVPPNAPVGWYDVAIRNPDGQSTVVPQGLAVVDEPIVPPSRVRVLRGLLESGGLPQLFSADSDPLIVKHNLAAEEVGSPITVEYEGDLGRSPWQDPRVKVRLRASTQGLRVKIQTFTAGEEWFTQVDTWCPIVDTTYVFSILEVMPNLQPVRCRILIDEAAFESVETWKVFIDQACYMK